MRQELLAYEEVCDHLLPFTPFTCCSHSFSIENFVCKSPFSCYILLFMYMNNNYTLETYSTGNENHFDVLLSMIH